MRFEIEKGSKLTEKKLDEALGLTERKHWNHKVVLNDEQKELANDRLNDDKEIHDYYSDKLDKEWFISYDKTLDPYYNKDDKEDIKTFPAVLMADGEFVDALGDEFAKEIINYKGNTLKEDKSGERVARQLRNPDPLVQNMAIAFKKGNKRIFDKIESGEKTIEEVADEVSEQSNFLTKDMWDTVIRTAMFTYVDNESLQEDTIKQNGKWTNKGREGTHGTFRTKKAADAQRKAMFAQGFKEGLNDNWYRIAQRKSDGSWDYLHTIYSDKVLEFNSKEKAEHYIDTELNGDRQKYKSVKNIYTRYMGNGQIQYELEESMKAKGRIINTIDGDFAYFFDDEAEKLGDILTLNSRDFTGAKKQGFPNKGRHKFTSIPYDMLDKYKDRVEIVDELKESLYDNEIDMFFKKAKRLGVTNLRDLKRLLTQEPETANGTDIQKMRRYYKAANPNYKTLKNEDLNNDKKVDKETVKELKIGDVLYDTANTWTITNKQEVNNNGRTFYTFTFKAEDGRNVYSLPATKIYGMKIKSKQTNENLQETLDDTKIISAEEFREFAKEHGIAFDEIVNDWEKEFGQMTLKGWVEFVIKTFKDLNDDLYSYNDEDYYKYIEENEKNVIEPFEKLLNGEHLKEGLKDELTIEEMFNSFGVENVFDKNGHFTPEALKVYTEVGEKYFDDLDEWDKLCDEEHCFENAELAEKLIQGKSEETVRKNTETEIKSGKSPKQAYAIAKSIQKKNMKENVEENSYDIEITEEDKNKWVKTQEDEEVWNTLSDDDKKFLILSNDMGFWFDEIQPNEELVDRYNDLCAKFSNSKICNVEESNTTDCNESLSTLEDDLKGLEKLAESLERYMNKNS